MLNDAASSAKPTKYVQNKRHGIYEGTRGMIDFGSDRCSAPKTANGMAKHKWLKTTILFRPLARARSVFATHSAIRKSRMAALHIETTGREISRNVARMVECMGMPGAPGVYPGHCFPGSRWRCELYYQERVTVSVCDRLTPRGDESPGFRFRRAAQRSWR